MKTKAEVETGDGYSVSLAKLLPEGVTIVDVTGYVSREFCDPCFKLCRLVLSTGEHVFIEGEHDFPYLTKCESLPDEQLEALAGEVKP